MEFLSLLLLTVSSSCFTLMFKQRARQRTCKLFQLHPWDAQEGRGLPLPPGRYFARRWNGSRGVHNESQVQKLSCDTKRERVPSLLPFQIADALSELLQTGGVTLHKPKFLEGLDPRRRPGNLVYHLHQNVRPLLKIFRIPLPTTADRYNTG